MGFVLADVGGPVRVTDLGNKKRAKSSDLRVAYGTKKTSVSLSDPHLTFYLTPISDIHSDMYSDITCIHYITLHDITLHYNYYIILYYITLHYIHIYILLEERKKKRCLNCLPTLTRKGYLSNKFGPIKKGKESQE